MTAILDYTSYAEVRAVLGVSEYELSDTTLALSMYGRYLGSRLRSTSGTFETYTGTVEEIYEELSDIASPTPAQSNFIDLIKQYALYIVAEACLSGLSLFALKQESDGKATQTRFSAEATFKDVASNIRQQLESCVSLISESLGVTDLALPMIGVITPATDRVAE